MPVHTTPAVVRFGDFEVDLRSGELRRRGVRLALQGRPLQVLDALLQSPGQLVARDTLRQRLWGENADVDVEIGLNAAVRRLREALGDVADVPRFVETLPRRGYRFIAPATVVPAADLVRPFDRNVGTLRLAVLPFANLTGDSTRDYLADGLSVETTAMLAEVDPLAIAVIGRTSTRRYKSAPQPARDIGRDLGAEYLVDGSVRGEAGRLRVTAALVRTRDEVQVWTGSYERDLTSVLELQRDLAGGIAEQIRNVLSPECGRPSGRLRTTRPEAYDRYLRGLFAHRQLTPSGNAAAVRLFEEAATLDPQFALAWCALAGVYATSGINGDAAPQTTAPCAREAARRALSADPGLAAVQVAVAQVRFWFDFDWPGADAAVRRALSIDAADADAWRVSSFFAATQGRHAEALSAAERSIALDPLNPVNHAAEAAFRRREPSVSLSHATRAVELDAAFWVGYILAAQAREQLGDTMQALALADEAERLSGGNSKALAVRGYLLARLNRTAEAMAALATLSSRAATSYVPPYSIALIHAGLGDGQATRAWLARMRETRDVHVVLVATDPKFEPWREVR
jgi:TolB-like protein/DNA-binding winged helix-turn-helix (wHTH) protein/Tfp pilus assembly protein PilF